jgi:hypothetical protein
VIEAYRQKASGLVENLGNEDTDGGVAAYRALVFADPAAYAQIPNDVWHLQGNRTPVRARDNRIHDLDGYLWDRAHFIADDTGTMVRPGDAAVLIEGCPTDDSQSFLIQDQWRDRLDGADLAAGSAGIVAEPEAHDQHR